MEKTTTTTTAAAKLLTIKEELAFLHDLAAYYDNDSTIYINDGASRAVFERPLSLAHDYGKLWFPNDVDAARTLAHCVIKISKGVGGFVQTQQEVGAYNFYRNSRLPLARVYAYGQFIEIREAVDIDGAFSDDDSPSTIAEDYDSGFQYALDRHHEDILDAEAFDIKHFEYSWLSEEQRYRLRHNDYGKLLSSGRLEEFYNYVLRHISDHKTLCENIRFDRRLSDAVLQARQELNEAFGDTTDNLQLGLARCRRQMAVVCYDYGFYGDGDWGRTHIYDSPINLQDGDDRFCLEFLRHLCVLLEKAVATTDKTHRNFISIKERAAAEVAFCREQGISVKYMSYNPDDLDDLDEDRGEARF